METARLRDQQSVVGETNLEDRPRRERAAISWWWDRGIEGGISWEGVETVEEEKKKQ